SFFVSSRRRHTRSKRDWSSDVCSSDLSELEAIIKKRADSEIAGALSAYVVDAQTGTVLLDHDATTARTPASTAKLFSGLLALDVLGPNSTLTTKDVKGSADEVG